MTWMTETDVTAVGMVAGLGAASILVAVTVSPWAGLACALLGGIFLITRSPDTTQRNRTAPVPDGGHAEIEMVTAIIRPGKLTAVKQALAEAGAPSLTVTNVSGRGTQPTETGQWRGEEYIVDLHQKVKVECAVTDDQTAAVVDAIQQAAHTGKPGDGKVFVMPVADACRVSTDERGVEAM